MRRTPPARHPRRRIWPLCWPCAGRPSWSERSRDEAETSSASPITPAATPAAATSTPANIPSWERSLSSATSAAAAGTWRTGWSLPWSWCSSTRPSGTGEPARAGHGASVPGLCRNPQKTGPDRPFDSAGFATGRPLTFPRAGATLEQYFLETLWAAVCGGCRNATTKQTHRGPRPNVPKETGTFSRKIGPAVFFVCRAVSGGRTTGVSCRNCVRGKAR